MTPISTPAERFATILQWLIKGVAARSDWRRPDQLPGPLVTLICIRISRISNYITRLAASIQAGTYRPRRFAPRRPPTIRRPRQPSRFPHRAGWLLRLAPGGLGVAGYRGWLETLLQDPEMIALMQAAPAAMARPIRSLCWMLLIAPPPILAQRPAPPKAAPAPALAPPPAAPHPPPAPCPLAVTPTPTPPPARGPPLPA